MNEKTVQLSGAEENRLKLIPYPTVWEPKNGKFLLGSNLAVECRDADAEAFRALLKPLPELSKPGAIALGSDASIPREGYRMRIGADRIDVAASGGAGFFYAAQTLRLLSDAEIPGRAEYAVPVGIIEDAPRFPYRGLLFDDARHFFGKAVLMRLIDRMAALKLNVLHWHLNDDQGWRIAIDQYPRLTEVGSKRRESQIGGGLSDRYDGKPVSGFYTKADVREILAYAAARHVTIVPEIDMPGHFTAVLAAYPELSCTGETVGVRTRFGISDLIACGGKEEVYRFAEDVLKEVAELFPAKLVHIGGDEAPKKYWDRCPDCEKKRGQLGLKDSHELQSYFTNRMVSVLKACGKETAGWNEALRGDGLDPSFIAEYWTPGRDRKAEDYFRDGGKIIFAKFQPFYFDYSYAQHPLRLTYRFERYAKNFDLDAENFLGVEGTLWSEWIEDERKLEYQAFPRLFALAESAWSKRKPGYADFKRRVEENRSAIERGFCAEFADCSLYDPKNPLLRLYRAGVWHLKNPDAEYKIHQKRRKKDVEHNSEAR